MHRAQVLKSVNKTTQLHNPDFQSSHILGRSSGKLPQQKKTNGGMLTLQCATALTDHEVPKESGKHGLLFPATVVGRNLTKIHFISRK